MKISKEDKRKILVYVILLLWIGFGVLAILFSTNFAELAVYFLSLTGFVGIYVWGESARKSASKSLIGSKSGPKSSREILTYITIILWAGIGVIGIIYETSLVSLAAYYGALTPFVGAYILGETYKQGLKKYTDVKGLQDKLLPDVKYDPDDNPEEDAKENPNMEF